MSEPMIVDRATWQAAREALLVREIDPAAAVVGLYCNGQVRELSSLHARDVTYATFREGGYEETVPYRGFEVMAPSYGLLDMTVSGRQETWEDSPTGWPQHWDVTRDLLRTDRRPTAQWSRLASGVGA